MKFAGWASWALGLWLWCAQAHCAANDGTLSHINSAELAIEQLGSGPNPGAAARVPQGLQWHPLVLPYLEDHAQRLAPPHSTVRIWVRLPAAALAAASPPQAVAYGAFMYNAQRVTLYVNSLPVNQTDRSLSNNWNAPVLLALPPSGVRAADEVLLSFDCRINAMSCAVPSFRVGTLAAVNSWYSVQQFWRIDGPRIGSMAMLTAGVIALLFWLRQRQASVYLLFALAAALWTLRTLHYHLPHYPQPVSMFWWVTDSALNWLSLTVYVFAFRLRNERRPRTERALLWAAIVLTVLNLPIIPDTVWFQDVIVNSGQTLISVLVTSMLTLAALRTRKAEQFALAAALWISLLFGVHDALLQSWAINMEHFFLLPYAALPILLAFIYALARRYGEALESSAALNASLEQRLASRQQELQHSYEQLRHYERERAQDEERRRLMREIHDGVGSTLISTLASVERGNMDRDATVSVLRDAVDEMRLMIDSLEPIGQDLVMLLATLRYRLAPRLDRLGLAMEWHMADLPPLPWLDSTSSLHILRIVQESISNTIKHSGARHIRVETTAGNTISLVISDDGRGFDTRQVVDGPGGRGLANLRHRALQIGATLSISSSSSGTCVTLQLPLQRVHDPRSGDDARAASR
jgi:signal transduction histidine kinase